MFRKKYFLDHFGETKKNESLKTLYLLMIKRVFTLKNKIYIHYSDFYLRIYILSLEKYINC